MKKLLYLLTFSLLLFSCQKVIDLKLDDKSGNYVIEGIVNKGDSVHIVKISKSVAFSTNNVFPAVTGAIVTLTDNNGNTTTLTDNGDGTYQTTNYKVTEGTSYTLTVIIDGKTYTASSTMPNQVNLDGIQFIPDSFADSAKTPIPLKLDPAGIPNYYMFDFYLKRLNPKKDWQKGWVRDSSILITDDTYSDGIVSLQPLFVSQRNIMPGDSIRLSMMCIDKNIYKYFFTLFQNGPGGAATPANPVTNFSGGCLGYFTAQTKQTILVEVPK